MDTKAATWSTLQELEGLLPKISWLWEGWIPRGLLSLIVGEPGVGKSLFALDLMRRATKGLGWPDGQKGGQPILGAWVETEAAQAVLLDRAKKFNIDLDRVLIPLFGYDLLEQPDLQNQDHRRRLAEMIRAKRPELLVIDSLEGAHRFHENVVKEMRPLLSFLANLARDTDTAIVVVHHLRKRSLMDGDRIGIDRIRGSTAIAGFARSVIGLEKAGEGQAKLYLVKSNLAKLPEPLSLSIDGGSTGELEVKYGLAPPEAPKLTRIEECAEWLRDTLISAGPQPVEILIEWAKAEGFSRATLFRAKGLVSGLESTKKGRTAIWKIEDSLT